MKCPYCSLGDTKVVDKRDSEDSNLTRRRRECLKCNKRFTTFERIGAVDIIVVKKDYRRERFDRNKLIRGIQRACEKRPISQDQIELLVDKIEAELRKKKTKEINHTVVGNLVIKKLKSLDKVAYIRFASVYREFDDLNSFAEELDKLLEKRKRRK